MKKIKLKQYFLLHGSEGIHCTGGMIYYNNLIDLEIPTNLTLFSSAEEAREFAKNRKIRYSGIGTLQYIIKYLNEGLA